MATFDDLPRLLSVLAGSERIALVPGFDGRTWSYSFVARERSVSESETGGRGLALEYGAQRGLRVGRIAAHAHQVPGRRKP